MQKLPKSLIKKYGISKKAWAVFRGRKHRRTSVTRISRPKRRVFRGGFMARRKHRSIHRVSGSPMRNLVGIVGYAVLEPTIDGLVSKVPLGVGDNIVKAAGGYILSKKGGIIGGIGSAMLTIEVYKFAKGGFSVGGIAGTTNAGGYM